MRPFIALLFSALAMQGAIYEIDIIPPADSLPVAFSKINSNFAAVAEGGVANSNLFIMRTNGWGLDTTISNTLTLSEKMLDWIETQGPFVVPIDTNYACTNTAGPYIYDSSDGGYTNECGWKLFVDDYPAVDSPYTNGFGTNQIYQYIHTITVSGAPGNNGTFTWTNWAFRHSSGDYIALSTEEGHWSYVYKAQWTMVRSNPDLLGDWGAGMSVSVGTYDTNWGFQPRTFVPQWDWYLIGAGDSSYDGLYSPYGTTTDLNLASLFWPNPQWHFTNGSGVKYVVQELPYTNITSVFSNSTPAYEDNRLDQTGDNVFSQTPAGAPSPSFYKLPNPSYATNAILLVPPLSTPGTAGEPNLDGGLYRWVDEDLNCFYLVKSRQYAAAIDQANKLAYESCNCLSSSMVIDDNGTAFLILFGKLVLTIPQSDTAEWQPCE